MTNSKLNSDHQNLMTTDLPQMIHENFVEQQWLEAAESSDSEFRKELASAAYYGTDQQVYAELRELAELVGIEIIYINPSRKNLRTAGLHKPIPNSDEAGVQAQMLNSPLAVLNFCSSGVDKRLRASFHPTYAAYFAAGSVELDLRADSAEILELMAAVGATVRGQVLGVVGAQGGIGTSTTALWIAREFARKHHSVAVIDLNPTSPGIDLIISGVGIPGKRWRDIYGSGSMLANRLAQVLPVWRGVRFLSADSRGGVDLRLGNGEKAIAALSQVHEWTVLDLPTRALDPHDLTHQWIEWCDAILLLSGVDAVSLAGTQARLADFSANANLAVVAVGAKNRGHLADIASQLGFSSIFGLRRQKSLAGDLEHGLAPGDKERSNSARDIRTICAALLETAEIAAAGEINQNYDLPRERENAATISSMSNHFGTKHLFDPQISAQRSENADFPGEKGKTAGSIANLGINSQQSFAGVYQ